MSGGPYARAARTMRCSADDVFAVLSDGWLYPAFVAGTSRMRDVEASWPRQGSRLHHSFGVWPLVIDDRTEVLAVEAPTRLVLKARGWPIGEALVTITIEPAAETVRVLMHEEAVTGPGRFVPAVVMSPLIWLRTRETLRRLRYLAEGRARSDR